MEESQEFLLFFYLKKHGAVFCSSPLHAGGEELRVNDAESCPRGQSGAAEELVMKGHFFESEEKHWE